MVMWLKAVVVWFGILLLAMANGLFREAVLIPQLGAQAGLPLSGVLLSLLILLVAFLSLPWIKPGQSHACWRLGLVWLLMTLLFEFSFGWRQGKSAEALLAAYRLEGGNLWLLVLLTTLLAPRVALAVRGRFA